MQTILVVLILSINIGFIYNNNWWYSKNYTNSPEFSWYLVTISLKQSVLSYLSHQSRPTKSAQNRSYQLNMSGLNWALRSISGSQECHYLTLTPLPPHLQSNLQPQTPAIGKGITLNDSYHEKILRLQPCVKKIKDVRPILLHSAMEGKERSRKV